MFELSPVYLPKIAFICLYLLLFSCNDWTRATAPENGSHRH